MQLPTINLNGTSQRDLLEQHLDAMDAIRTAIDLLQRACPNGRDYVPQGTPEGLAALYRAQEEHNGRVLRLRTVLAEIETIAEHLA